MDEKKPRLAGAFSLVQLGSLDSLNVRCLLALRACGHFERHALVLLQGLEAIRLNCREVSEQIFAAFVRSDKAEALCVIEPFYDTSCHYISYYS